MEAIKLQRENNWKASNGTQYEGIEYSAFQPNLSQLLNTIMHFSKLFFVFTNCSGEYDWQHWGFSLLHSDVDVRRGQINIWQQGNAKLSKVVGDRCEESVIASTYPNTISIF